MVLELDKEKLFKSYPFKLNRVWLEDDSFCSMLIDNWQDSLDISGLPPMLCFLKKLSKLSVEVKSWEKNKKLENQETLRVFEDEIEYLENSMNDDYFSSHNKDRLAFLNAERSIVLLKFEKTLRLKSRAVWLEVGDNNSKFFHHFANHKRVSNSIWELKNKYCIMLGEQSTIMKELVRHFQEIYNQDQSLTLPQQLKVLKNFPNFFSAEEGQNVGAKVSKEEVKYTLSQFSKDLILPLYLMRPYYSVRILTLSFGRKMFRLEWLL